MILKLSKRALLSAMIFQAKKDARYYLNGICFAPDKKLYSSDGHRAFIGEHDSAELTENIIVSIRGQKITSFERAEIDTNAGLVLYLDDHGIRVGAGLCDVIDGRYPDIESVISRFKSKPTDEIGFNAGYLVDIEKAAKLFDPKFCCVKIKPNGNADASIIEFRSSSDKGTLVIYANAFAGGDMKKQSYRHTCVHKNLARLDYLNRFNQLAVSKLRQMFEESKKHQREAQNESRA